MSGAIRNQHASLRQYEVFEAIADELHFGRAAQRLGVAQPGLTQQLQSLEEFLGGERLFDRNRRKVLLTEYGAGMLPEVRALLRQARRVEEIATLLMDGRRGHLEIGYVGSASYSGILGQILRRFREGAADVDLVLKELDMDIQVQEIVAGRMDAGFVRLPLSDIPDCLSTISVLQEDILLAVPHGHRLEARQYVSLAELSEESFIFTHLGPDMGFAACAYRLCAGAGFSPRIVHRARQFTAIVSFVVAGLGVAFVPASASRMTEFGVTFLPITDAAIKSIIGLAYLENPANPALRRLLEAVPPA